MVKSYIYNDFNIEIMKDSSDTYLEKQLMEYEINSFLYYFTIIPIKKV